MLERRTVLKGVIGAPLALLLAGRCGVAAIEAAAPIKLRTPGGRVVPGALVKPDKMPAPILLLIHDEKGLDERVKAAAVGLANQGYIVLAIDLFGGQLAATAGEAQDRMRGVNADEAADTLAGWIGWAKVYPQGTRRVGLIGWGAFGGGWALSAATLAPVEAVVLHGGRCDLPADRLAKLAGPVLGHFGNRDAEVGKAMVTAFTGAMKTAGKAATVYWYDTVPRLAESGVEPDPTGQQAELRTQAFLEQALKG